MLPNFQQVGDIVFYYSTSYVLRGHILHIAYIKVTKYLVAPFCISVLYD